MSRLTVQSIYVRDICWRISTPCLKLMTHEPANMECNVPTFGTKMISHTCTASTGDIRKAKKVFCGGSCSNRELCKVPVRFENLGCTLAAHKALQASFGASDACALTD